MEMCRLALALVCVAAAVRLALAVTCDDDSLLCTVTADDGVLKASDLGCGYGYKYLIPDYTSPDVDWYHGTKEVDYRCVDEGGNFRVDIRNYNSDPQYFACQYPESGLMILDQEFLYRSDDDGNTAIVWIECGSSEATGSTPPSLLIESFDVAFDCADIDCSGVEGGCEVKESGEAACCTDDEVFDDNGDSCGSDDDCCGDRKCGTVFTTDLDDGNDQNCCDAGNYCDGHCRSDSQYCSDGSCRY